jgi:hypothetical protein
MPAPGDGVDQGRKAARLAILRDYYQGPIENHFGPIMYPPYPSGEQEADIQWFLEYFEP